MPTHAYSRSFRRQEADVAWDVVRNMHTLRWMRVLADTVFALGELIAGVVCFTLRHPQRLKTVPEGEAVEATLH